MIVLSYLSTSIGKKLVMAVTGLLVMGFLCGHLAGNLLLYWGPEAINSYAEHLESLGPLLWIIRLGLLSAFVLHIGSAISLSIDNRRARPKNYKKTAAKETTLAAKSMMYSGILILVYVIYHLMHFTFKKTHPEFALLHDSLGRHDVYTMVVTSFREPKLVIGYLIALSILCLHLSHAISSVFQTLGMSDDQKRPLVKFIGSSFAGLLFLGYASIPVACWFGWVRPL